MKARHTSPPSGADEHDIQFHYDVSNDFYTLWLDANMVYSAAIWKDGQSLEEAQMAKIAFHIDQIDIPPGSRVLDIGCGWGATLKTLVNDYQCNDAVGLTLSEEQRKWIQSLRNKKISVHLQTWEEFKTPDPFDGIISIGAYEHFCRPGLTREEKIAVQRRFFSFCHSVLKPDGILSLQTISYGPELPEGQLHPFIATDIFPNSDLPRLDEIKEAINDSFELIVLRNDPSDYEKTCHRWRWTLKTKRDSAVGLVGEEMVNKFQLYLQLAERGFRFGQLDLLRLKLKKRRS